MEQKLSIRLGDFEFSYTGDLNVIGGVEGFKRQVREMLKIYENVPTNRLLPESNHHKKTNEVPLVAGAEKLTFPNANNLRKRLNGFRGITSVPSLGLLAMIIKATSDEREHGVSEFDEKAVQSMGKTTSAFDKEHQRKELVRSKRRYIRSLVDKEILQELPGGKYSLQDGILEKVGNHINQKQEVK